MSCRIGIYDKDMSYSYELMEYINSHSRPRLKASVFSNLEVLCGQVSRGQLDLALVCGGISLTCQDVPVVYIVEDRSHVIGDNHIYKYQNASNIASKLEGYYNSIRGRDSDSGSVIGVYSPLGRCGKTSLAQAICKYYGDSIYVNMEEYPSILQSMEYIDSFSYYLVANNPKLLELIQTLEKDAYGTVNIFGFRSYMDLRQVKEGDIAWFIQLLRDNLSFKTLVFDIGQGGLSDYGVLRCMDKVVIPVLEDRASVKKVMNFKMLLEEFGGENMGAGYRYVNLCNCIVGSKSYDSFIEMI